MKKAGICYLVGAGPGDPGLLTLKGRSCLEKAGVVIYDHLANPEFLEFAPEAAEKIYAGKRAGDHALRQDDIQALLVKNVRAGRVVVRLKGGDPFLFGRGGEEAEALAAAGCRFEIVPGVSSAIAGPAYAGIPVTHRSHNAAVTIFTGHEDPDKPESQIDYDAIAAIPGTKVMLMGVERLESHCAALQKAGMPGSTPVALVRWATTPRQETLGGTLADIAAKARAADFQAPAVVILGEVVAFKDSLAWFENKPLFGKRIAVTRTRQQAGELIDQLRDLGADAYELPTIRIEPPADKKAFYELVSDAHIYDWIIFTSPNGVDTFFRAFFEIFSDVREIGGVRIAAIGPATAARVKAHHLAVDLQPEKFVAEEVLKALQKETSVENLKFLLPRAEGAREMLATELTKLGAIVDEAIAYRTVPETEGNSAGIRRFKEEGADIVTFTSSSTAENFAALKLPLPETLRTASIGPVTSATLMTLGFSVDIEARSHDIPGLVQAILSSGSGGVTKNG
ncbi:MAG: uroporphyrinogen-III C-methyltransferase [Terrimicrobiaceae bacterium]